MFRNNYHPAFVMGLVCFTAGIFFLCIGGIIYKQILNSDHYISIGDISSDYETWFFFIGTLVTGFLFIAAGIGVMRQNKIARNIAVVLCLLCLIGLILLYSVIVLEMRDRLPQIILLSGLFLFIIMVALSTILVLTGNNAREYFGEDKIDTHEDLLDNI